MGNTYETDEIEKREELALAIRAAITIKAITNLIGCRSWLVARLTIQEARTILDDLAKTIDAGSSERKS